MKYIINEDKNVGIQNVDDATRANLIKLCGYESKVEDEKPLEESVEEPLAESTMVQRDVVEESEEVDDSVPTLYEWNGQYFRLEEDVYEFEDELFVRVSELEEGTVTELTEGIDNPFTSWVTFDDMEYTLQEAYDFEDDVYIKLAVNEEKKEEKKPIDHSEADAYAKKIGKKYAPGMEGDMEHHADVKAKYPDYVQRNLRDKNGHSGPDGQVKKR